MTPSPALPSGLRRDTLLNLAGQLLPLAVAVAAVPATTAGLGVERFGVLALAWTVLGSFNVFDLALGRAVTRFAAEALAQDEPERLPGLLWSATGLQAALGIVAAAAFAAASPLLAGAVLQAPPPLADEIRRTFLILALSFPVTLVTGCFRSLLEAAGRFDLVNLVRAPAGAATFAIPWLGAAAGWDLPAIIGLLVLTRALVLVVHWRLCRRALPVLVAARAWPAREPLARLARFGGWITASNVIPPLLTLVERFLLGALVSLA
ncbi:MAG TPA: oligosaccharide flippase family protein, partial [Thermoanaerobaculia bacterium]|nr:oligosaccharide flippase family protein [Thermoanaerobaculia bacterium]